MTRQKTQPSTSRKEGPYIQFARDFVNANTAKNEASRLEKRAKQACARAMHDSSVTTFKFNVGNVPYTAALDRSEAMKVSVRHLYTMVRENEITLDEFLDCCSASQEAVSETIGPARLSRVLKTVLRPLDLRVKIDT